MPPPRPRRRLSPWALALAGVPLALVLFLLDVSGREGAYRWGWYVVLPTTPTGMDNLRFLVGGLWLTIRISVLATLLATVLGLLLTLPGLSADPWARGFDRLFVEVFRAIPSLVMLLWVHYGLPVPIGVRFSVFTSGVIGLALCEAAFMAEVFNGWNTAWAPTSGSAEGTGGPGKPLTRRARFRRRPRMTAETNETDERVETDNHGHDHGEMIADFRRRFVVSLVLTLPILALSPLLQRAVGLEDVLAFPGDRYVLFALATVVFVYGGRPFLAGLVSEVGDRQPGMMTLIGLAITVAYVYSSAVTFGLEGEAFFWELATLVDVMLLGHWVEMRSVAGASGALENLVRLLPDEARRLDEKGNTEDVAVADLEVGDRVLVRPGERVPADGVVVDGSSSVDLSMLTGESEPVRKGEGDEVPAGAVNGSGALTLEIEKTGADSYLNQLVEMVEEAQQSRSRGQDLADRAAGWLTYTALGVGAVTLVAWLAVGAGMQQAIARMVTVMVITCPHALGLAVPLVVAVSTSLGAKSGLLIRNRGAFERARELDAVVFDKTGTLTEGRFGVQKMAVFGELDEAAMLRLAAGLERASEHPIAAAIVAEAESRELELPDAEDFENLEGRGAEATVDGRRVVVASRGHMAEEGLEADDERLDALAEGGRTVVLVAVDGTLVGAVALADEIRDSAKEAIRQLHDRGISCLMLTGDGRAVAEAVARELGIDEVMAEILPDEKAAKVREVKASGKRVAMVGDGVNDAPALLEADLGIAIGAGTDVAIGSADVVLVRDDPRDVVAVLTLAGATWRKMIENFVLASGYNVVAIPLAAGIGAPWGLIMPPAAGAALMSLSTVVVAINARLLQRTER
ncbi:MAG: heavy metal translocating P-type ATPase, partial [Pseudomonadota bacterium]